MIPNFLHKLIEILLGVFASSFLNRIRKQVDDHGGTCLCLFLRFFFFFFFYYVCMWSLGLEDIGSHRPGVTGSHELHETSTLYTSLTTELSSAPIACLQFLHLRVRQAVLSQLEAGLL